MKDNIEIVHLRTTDPKTFARLINDNLDEHDKVISVVPVGSMAFWIVICRNVSKIKITEKG